jgi:hypothetical protein
MGTERQMKRLWIVLGALAVTLGALAVAMLLGSASFDFRRYAQHENRLRKVMREQPTAGRLTQGLHDEGTLLLAAARTREEKERAIASSSGEPRTPAPRIDDVRAKALRYPEMRVYQASDMLYFVFFDEAGVMRDFTCVSR